MFVGAQLVSKLYVIGLGALPGLCHFLDLMLMETLWWTQVVGNDSPSLLIAFSTKSISAGQLTSKLHVIELGAQPGWFDLDWSTFKPHEILAPNYYGLYFNVQYLYSIHLFKIDKKRDDDAVSSCSVAATSVPVVLLGRDWPLLIHLRAPSMLYRVQMAARGSFVSLVCDPDMHTNLAFDMFLCRKTGLFQEGSRSIFPARFCWRLPRCNAGILLTAIFSSCGQILSIYT